jgi:L-arabinose isomerase
MINMGKIKVGLLLLYLKLYDDKMPDLRKEFEPFIKDVKNRLEQKELEVKVSPICRLDEEFKKAVKDFEASGVNVIVTLHLAYSPSLECVSALTETKLPIVVLDTTVKYHFSNRLVSNDIMLNHGIHGVQDMCNILLRNNKNFLITTGHFEKSDLLDRLVKKIKSVAVFNLLNTSRVGRLGGPFYGMGDFYVPKNILKRDLGIVTIEGDFTEVANLMPNQNDKLIQEEVKSDLSLFDIGNLESDVHFNSVRIGIAVRRWIEQNKLDAFTINFSNLSSESGFPTIPFLEASKAMARGIGYAGEGDVMTAGLVGSLLKIYPETSFTEMFCPDWKENIILLSHMGELNISLVSGKSKLIMKDLPFIQVSNPAVAIGQFKEGKAVLVNFSPSLNNYTLILSHVEMIDLKHELKDSVTGWIKPEIPIDDFLSEYSKAGGSHHSAIVYGNVYDELLDFGRIMGCRIVEI